MRAEGYDAAYFRDVSAIEEEHFWFRARRRLIGTVVTRLAPAWDSTDYALEVGCGTGQLLRVLEQTFPGKVIGLDLFQEGLEFARQGGRSILVRGDANQFPFRASFSLIGAFDLIEHVADDVGLLQSLREGLNTGGYLLLTVPARASLWSYFDEEARHQRRYERSELLAKLRASGFTDVYATYYMTALLPLLWLKRRLLAGLQAKGVVGGGRNRAKVMDELRIHPLLNRVLRLALAPELFAITRRISLPLGTALFVVARK